jgi:hypothetical protein
MRNFPTPVEPRTGLVPYRDLRCWAAASVRTADRAVWRGQPLELAKALIASVTW